MGHIFFFQFRFFPAICSFFFQCVIFPLNLYFFLLHSFTLFPVPFSLYFLFCFYVLIVSRLNTSKYLQCFVAHFKIHNNIFLSIPSSCSVFLFLILFYAFFILFFVSFSFLFLLYYSSFFICVFL